jgi:hypothetical protein
MNYEEELAKERLTRRSSLMVDTVIDANNGFPELRKRNPELYKEITERQQAVAACRRRAANSPILRMKIF